MFLFTHMLPKLRVDFYEPSLVFFQNFPIPAVDSSNTTEIEQRDQLFNLVGKMLELHKYNPTTPQEKERQQGIIDATASTINKIVFLHYRLGE